VSAVLTCDEDFALEVIRLYQAFTQDLILEAVSGVLWSEEFEELCIELAGDLDVAPTRAGTLLHRVTEESRRQIRGIEL